MDRVRPPEERPEDDLRDIVEQARSEEVLNAEPGSSDDDQGVLSRRRFVGSFAAAMATLTGKSEAYINTARQPVSPCDHPKSFGKMEWHQLPPLFGMFYLVFMRDWLRNANLYDTEDPPLPPRNGPIPQGYERARTLDGTWNDLDYPTMGSCGRRFGRNVPLSAAFPDPAMLDPNPRAISTALMTRDSFKPAEALNVLAAAWIQFQVHDWFAHESGRMADVHTVPVPAGDPWPHAKPITFPRTPADGTSSGCIRPPAYKNLVPHWWDGSQLYGSSQGVNDKIRTHRGGMIRVQPNGLLEVDANGEVTGFMPNGWMGVSMLHGIFALEHNAICRKLAGKHPLWSDDHLYHTARLIVAGLLAKIHTLDWTLAALQTTVLKAAMRTNWKGLTGVLQEISKTLRDSELLGGIVGSPTDHHTAPYAMTEEFVAVYRMHPLMPDDFTLYSADDGTTLELLTLPDVAGANGRRVLERYQYRVADLFYSFGVTHPGAITLKNYPRHLQELKRPDDTYVDLAALEIVRDRERGIPRYNAFRHLLGKRPLRDFKELTCDETLADQIRDVYRHIDRVDTMVGLLAETPPDHFAFSETAFRIFILMASRRLKSDRFYTSPYWSEETYTKEGLEWIDENSMATVIRRHFPQLRCRIGGHDNAFRPWARV